MVEELMQAAVIRRGTGRLLVMNEKIWGAR